MSGKLLAGVGQASIRSASVSPKEDKNDGGDFNRVLGEAVSAQESTAGTPERSTPVSSNAQKDAGEGNQDGGQRDETGEKSGTVGILLAQAVLAAGLMPPTVSAAPAQTKPAAGQAAQATAVQTEVPAGKPAAGLAPAIAPAGGNNGGSQAVGTGPLLSAADQAVPAAAAVRADSTRVAMSVAGNEPAAQLPVKSERAAVLPESGDKAPVAVHSSGPAILPAQSGQNVAALRPAVTAHAAAGNVPQAAETKAGGAVAEVAGASSGHESAQAQSHSSNTGGQAAGQPAAWTVPIQTAVRAGGVSFAGQPETHATVQSVARQIAATVNDSAAGRTGQLRLHLSPADLGGINLRFATENGRVTLQITADSSQTGALLTAHLDELNRSLVHSGVTMDRTEVFCQTGTGSQSGGQSGGAPPGFGGQAGAGGHRNARQDAAVFSAPSVSEEPRPAAESVSETPAGISPGTMSIFA